jgi:hypothetical protein
MKISQELRENIINDLKNNVSLSDIMNKYNVSKATIYRMRKIIESENEDTNNNISNNNISQINVSTNDNNDIKSQNETNEDEENEEETKSNISEFNINEFKKELNNENKSIINI